MRNSKWRKREISFSPVVYLLDKQRPKGAFKGRRGGAGLVDFKKIGEETQEIRRSR